MNGPDSLNYSEGHESALKMMMKNSDMAQEEIGLYIARAHRLRAEQMARLGEKVARSWKNLFHRSKLSPEARLQARLEQSYQI